MLKTTFRKLVFAVSIPSGLGVLHYYHNIQDRHPRLVRRDIWRLPSGVPVGLNIINQNLHYVVYANGIYRNDSNRNEHLSVDKLDQIQHPQENKNMISGSLYELSNDSTIKNCGNYIIGPDFIRYLFHYFTVNVDSSAKEHALYSFNSEKRLDGGYGDWYPNKIKYLALSNRYMYVLTAGNRVSRFHPQLLKLVNSMQGFIKNTDFIFWLLKRETTLPSEIGKVESLVWFKGRLLLTDGTDTTKILNEACTKVVATQKFPLQGVVKHIATDGEVLGVITLNEDKYLIQLFDSHNF